MKNAIFNPQSKITSSVAEPVLNSIQCSCRNPKSAMPHLNIEIKARCTEHDRIRDLLKARQARFVGEDHQVDTYFRTSHGRLKLREGSIERNLIYYERPDQQGPKASYVTLYKPGPGAALKQILTQVLGVLVVVDKRREIYFIDHVKFHLNRVDRLGTFVEIEAIDVEGTIGEARLHEQCAYYLDLLKIAEEDLVRVSYSDLLLQDRET